ncbi:hypothetical protein [Bremerella alba]|uniref:Uncharacterized protein n=1 Tax=Bremerella alba TaxID=980252 RepID=A0A7V8V2J1_9BACT|nr:hypothetical protein [Bremerella alba]MBA2113715.1 hypothetical protein [Bremerella alba]
MKNQPRQRSIDMSQPGAWAMVESWFLFAICIGSLLVASVVANDKNNQVFGGLLFCGGMLALIASILLFDRYKREAS